MALDDDIAQEFFKKFLKRADEMKNMPDWNFAKNKRIKLKSLSNEASCATVIIKCWKRFSDPKLVPNWFYCTGFIISSRKSTLIISCGEIIKKFFDNASMTKINLEVQTSVEFYDTTIAEAVFQHVDFSHNVSILKVEGVCGKKSMRFGGGEYDANDIYDGLPVYSISHPLSHGTIQPFLFTMGEMSQRCIPVPKGVLDPNSDCLAYSLPLEVGSAGAPVFDYEGRVIAIHCSSDNSMYFGVGLKSIKVALLKYFGLHDEFTTYSVNNILMFGLGKQRLKEEASTYGLFGYKTRREGERREKRVVERKVVEGEGR